MASPVVTGSYTQEYEPYRQAVNEIVYSKQQWQKGQQEGNKGLQTWAANNAQQYYNQLPTHLANQLRGMDLASAQNLLASLSSNNQRAATTATDTRQGVVNPYDQQVADLIAQMTQGINQPRLNPLDGQVFGLINELRHRINNPTVVDPRSTPEYAAGKAAIDRQVADNIRMAQESLGASGFARSTNLLERAQTIADAGTEYLETQLVPQIAQQLYQRDQQGLMNSMAILDALMQQQGMLDERQRREVQDLNTLLNALTGQQGLFDTRQQTAFENQLALDRHRLQERIFEFEQQQTAIENERAEIDAALRRTEAFGVVSEQDAQILGVPAGTPSYAAREAAAQRQHQLDMLNREINAQRENLRMRIEADQRAASINQLLALWEATGSAPAGLEQFGVTPGQEYSPYLTPSQRLDQIQLDQVLEEIRLQERMSQMIPEYQRKYQLDPMSAEALVNALDNPSYEAVMADIQANEPILRQMGVNVEAVRNAINNELNVPTEELERLWRSSVDTSRVPKLDWMRWYRDPRGRVAGLTFDEYIALYPSEIR